MAEGSESDGDLIRRLRTYAEEQVEANRSQLIANLTAKQAPLVLDVAFPGAAYYSVAAGGVAEVLHLLGDKYVQVDRFIGASGGACSAFLILANQEEQPAVAVGSQRCPNSVLLLQSYLGYARSEGTMSITRFFNAIIQTFGVSSFWEHRYRDILRQEISFHAVRERAFCAVASKPIKKATGGKSAHSRDTFEAACDNYIFHDFDSREQIVQAFVATGEATLKGFTRGINVVDATDDGDPTPVAARASFTLLSAPGQETDHAASVFVPHTYCDGGHPAAMKVSPAETDGSRNALLYYHTFFSENQGDVAFCTPESVERLFKRGVDRTIGCLSSPDLCDLGSALGDAMVVVPVGAGPQETMAKIGRGSALEGGAFVSLRDHKIFNT